MLMQKLKRLSVGLLPHRLIVGQTLVLLVCAFIIFTAQAEAVIRFTNRSLFIYNPAPSATTQYKVSLTYNNAGVYTTTVGSIDMLFCMDPIPTDPCQPPAGLNVSKATLSSQTGETGFSVLSTTANQIILTRSPSPVTETPSTYTLSNIVNPTDTTHSFAIRLSDYPTTDASGALVDLGSVLSESSQGVEIETQVPGILVFCVAQQVTADCNGTQSSNYTNMGTLSPTKTLTATSQMGAGTNASNGYAITVYGTTMEAGNNVIDALASPTPSAPGNSQFGINLVANTSPGIGANPIGGATNTSVAANYDTPNEFMFHNGDEVASASAVSFVKRFTVSYIVNSPPNIRPGVYTTTLTFICTGRF